MEFCVGQDYGEVRRCIMVGACDTNQKYVDVVECNVDPDDKLLRDD